MALFGDSVGDGASGIPAVYYVDDIAKAWQVDKTWIVARIRDGRFEAVKIGRRWAMTEAQIASALDTASNGGRRQQRTERDEWRPPNGMSPRSWAYRQRWPDGNPHMRTPHSKPDDLRPFQREESPLPASFAYVRAAAPEFIASLPQLSERQQRLLEQVGREGSVVVDGRYRKAVEALAIRGLATYDARYVTSEKTPGFIYEFTVAAVGGST